MANNNASKASQAFEKVADNSNVEEFLIDIYVHFDYSWKRNMLLLSFVSFVISTIAEPWGFAVSTGLACQHAQVRRAAKLITYVKSYFLSDSRYEKTTGIKNKK